jgi:Tfp pilus assembly protein PilF
MKKKTVLFLAAAAVLLAVACNKAAAQKQPTPKTAEDYQTRGLEYLNNGNYDRAIADFTQAIKLDPNDTIVYNNRVTAYYEKGDYDQAIAD